LLSDRRRFANVAWYDAILRVANSTAISVTIEAAFRTVSVSPARNADDDKDLFWLLTRQISSKWQKLRDCLNAVSDYRQI
jgi:mevalonate pyrophosphate decarboxylase